MRLLWIVLLAASAAGEAAEYYFPPPGESLDVQNRQTPAAAGVNVSVIAKLDGIAERWALWRNGRLIHVAGDFNQTGDVKSHRKTWHAATVGAALLQGRIPSIDQRLSEWLPNLEGHHAEATWRDVMMQTSGFDYPYAGQPAYRPGQIWTYSDWNPVRLTSALDQALFPGADAGWAYAAGAGGNRTYWSRKFGLVLASFGEKNLPRRHGVPHILEEGLEQ